MCQACKGKTKYGDNFPSFRDIQRACREGQAATPSWLRPPRSVKAELTHQLRRLQPNAIHEVSE